MLGLLPGQALEIEKVSGKSSKLCQETLTYLQVFEVRPIVEGDVLLHSAGSVEQLNTSPEIVLVRLKGGLACQVTRYRHVREG